MRLAIIIPTYNRAQLALKAVRSALVQMEAPEGLRPDEIIVVDDGSKDDTPTVIGDLPGIRYIRQVNQGLSAARNTGIRATDAEYVAFLDDDDAFLPGKIAQDLKALAEHPDTDFLYGNGRRVSPSGEDLGLCLQNHTPPARPLTALLEENYVLVQTVVARRSILLDAGLFDPQVRLCEDVDLWLRVAARTDRFRYVPEPLVDVLRMPGSMSADPIRMQEALLAASERHAALIRSALGPAAGDSWLAAPNYRLGRAFFDRGNRGQALKYLRAAVAADPAHRTARLYLRMALCGGLARGAFELARSVKRLLWKRLAERGQVESRW
jgi:glycosyltransferase involved in cell wall biosynthesis